MGNSEFEKMICVSNIDYEDCMTLGKVYDVEAEPDARDSSCLYKFVDDNREPLQTMVRRFEKELKVTLYKEDYYELAWNEILKELCISGQKELREITVMVSSFKVA